MIPIEEAEKILNRVAFRTGTEEVPLMESLGRILGQDVVSGIYMPPFNKSAMDGYAISSQDDSAKFEVVEVIAAGSVPVKKINKGQCAKIMTGAMVPEGADRVVKIEITSETDGFMRITGEDENLNVCLMGEDVKPGDVILKAGHLIRPPELGVIASMGLDSVIVNKKAKVGIVTTGSEIVTPGRA
ncbi:MAG: molybdopterin molybdotransferase MoeA, partial [bacterium]|nr:molybdopterin molybdotransferase MoeA [bacterium]